MTWITVLRLNGRDGRDGVDFNVESVQGTFHVSREALEDIENVESVKGEDQIKLFDKHAQSICQAAADLSSASAQGNPIVVSYADVLKAQANSGTQDIGG